MYNSCLNWLVTCMSVSSIFDWWSSAGLDCPIDKAMRQQYNSVLSSIPRGVADKEALIERFERKHAKVLSSEECDQSGAVSTVRAALRTVDLQKGFSMDVFCDLRKFENLSLMGTSYSLCPLWSGMQMRIIEHCGRGWLDRVLDAEQSLRNRTELLDSLRSLIDFEMLATLKTGQPAGASQPVSRPYSGQDLHGLANDFNQLGVIMYMNDSPTASRLLNLDKSLQNPSLTEPQFRQAYAATVMPLCRMLCSRLQGQAYAFAKSLLVQCIDHSRRTSADDTDPVLSPQVEEILAAAHICCELSLPFDGKTNSSGKNFYNTTFNLIRGSSSPRMIRSNSLKLAKIAQAASQSGQQ